MREARIGYKSLVYYLLHSVKESIPRDLARRKEEKYGGNDGVYYVRWGSFVFTCKNMKDSKGREITKVITLIDQREMLMEAPPGEGRWT